MTQPPEPDEDATRHTYEYPAEERPSEAVVSAVADATGQSPLELDPLYEVINPDAVDTLLTPTDITPSRRALTFDYCGSYVTVTPSDVQVEV